MEKRHEEYVAYYEARMKRFENDPLYKNSYEAEKVMYHAIADIEKLEEFRTIIERDHPEVKCAIALVKDQETARLQHFRDLDEPIRALSPERILKEIDKAKTAMDVATIVPKIDQEVSVLISVDSFFDGFYSDFTGLENLEVLEAIKNEVPGAWRKEIEEEIKEMTAQAKKLFHEVTLPDHRNYDP